MKVLIPAISEPRVTTCLMSLVDFDPLDIIIVDNTVGGLTLPYVVGKHVHLRRNLGVARSWNIGLTNMYDTSDDYLVVCSQSIVFGPDGAENLRASVVGTEWGTEYAGMGWHLNAFSSKFASWFGFFDENFWPAYFEDTDALYRMGLLGIPSPRENGLSRPQFQIDAECSMVAGALTDGVAAVDFDQLRLYYTSKWGGEQGREKYKKPFGNRRSKVGINWWPGVDRAGQDYDL